MLKVEVLYADKSFAPVTYNVDGAKRDGDILIMNTCKDDVVTKVSYIHLSHTIIVSITKTNGGNANESAKEK